MEMCLNMYVFIYIVNNFPYRSHETTNLLKKSQTNYKEPMIRDMILEVYLIE